MIQDSSDIDLSRHSKRLTGKQLIGPIGNHQGLGFIMHSAFVLDARLLTPIGFSSVQMFHRTTNEQTSKQKHAANHHKPIELKESYKWIKACEEAKKYLSKANHITIIEDREGDIFEQFARIPDKRTDLIVRSKSNRQIIDGGKLFEILSNESVAGIYEIGIDADARKKKAKRTAKLEVRFCRVSIQKPKSLKSNVDEVKLYSIEAKEIGYEGKDKVHWRLLTTYAITGFKEAIRIIKQYEQRWFIEQVHRLLKKKGFRIEDSELENGGSIRKLTLFQLINVLRVMQMLLCYGNENGQPLTEVFSNEETKCLKKLNDKYETAKLKNPYCSETLTWATWIIARIAGWKKLKRLFSRTLLLTE